MNMKKILTMLIALLMAATLTCALAEEEPTVHSSGDYQYLLLADGTAKITLYSGKMQELVIPAEMDGYRVTTIGDAAFASNRALISVTIPDSITTIGAAAFSFCRSLTSVTIPESITTIGDAAFSYCRSLTSITIPDSVTTIGCGAFSACEALASIAVSPDHPTIGTIDGALFDKSTNTLIYVPYSATTNSYAIPQGIRSIGDDVFACCNSLTSVTIPDSVTSIGADAFTLCFDAVFTVGRDSYAEQYCIDNGLPYTCADTAN